MFMGFLGLLLLGSILFVVLNGGNALTKAGKSTRAVKERAQTLTEKQILAERLARGDINEEEYDRIRKRLES